MNGISLISLVKRHFGTLLLTGLFFGAASFFALTFFSKRFIVTTDYQVIQSATQAQDYYTQFKSAEYMGKILADAIHSERFVTEVIATGKVNAEFLPFDKKDRLKEWQKTVSVANTIELGKIRVSVRAESERETNRIMEAISTVLIEKNKLFRGGDEKSVEIRVLSGPILERNPTPERIFQVTIIGFLLGAFLAFSRVLFRNKEFLFDSKSER